MAEVNISCNCVNMTGRAVLAPKYSHIIYGEKFYEFQLSVERNSGRTDIIPMVVSERTTDVSVIAEGMLLEISGQFRSFNRFEDGYSRLILTVFVQKLVIHMEKACPRPLENTIYLDGFLSRRPFIRQTPTGRDISEIMLAVNRRNASDYIPCICWGKYARAVYGLPLGTRMMVWGRVQSRMYRRKVVTEGKILRVPRTVYEISIGKMQICGES